MKLYEIDKQIQNAIDFGCDPETGEILDGSVLDELMMEREDKIENIILLIKNITAETNAIRDEEIALAKRRKTGENRAEWLKKYVSASLNGEKFQTPRCSASFRKTKAVKIMNSEAIPEDYIRIKAEPNTMAIKDALKAGEEVPGAVLEDRLSLIIK